MNAPLPTHDTAGIRQRLHHATPGPWRADVLGSEGYAITTDQPGPTGRPRVTRIARCGYTNWDQDKANAEFIAHARTDIETLLSYADISLSRIITTPEDRDALPAETIVMSADGTAACRHYSGAGVLFGDERTFAWDALSLPFFVLWNPEWGEVVVDVQ